MQLVAVTAFGIGGATVFGALLGFLFPKVSHRASDAVMSFAAGVMLAAAILGLILPALDLKGFGGVWTVVFGIFFGAFFLNLMDRLTPHLHRISGLDKEEHHNGNINKVLLFVLAIAIHNLPEGLATGVSFGGGSLDNALSVAIGIALQNVPEGMIIISPMLMAGMSKKRTFLIAASTGLIEVLGTFLGYAATSVSATILPFALSFAGGTMIYVVGDEMIPETHSHGYERIATYSLLGGFALMLVMDWYI